MSLQLAAGSTVLTRAMVVRIHQGQSVTDVTLSWQRLRFRRKLVYMRTVNPDTTKKWEKTGLLERLTPSEASKMAELLERTACRLVRDPSGKKQLSLDDGGFLSELSLVFPLVRRVFGQLEYELGYGDEPTQMVGSFSIDELLSDGEFKCLRGIDVEVEICDQLSRRITAWIKEKGAVTVGKNPLRLETLKEGDNVTGYFVSVDLCPLI